MLEREFQYYIENQNELVKDFNGKFLVIKDQTVIGVYDTEEDAYFETEQTHELGTFLIQYCEQGNRAYTQSFHSAVTFA